MPIMAERQSDLNTVVPTVRHQQDVAPILSDAGRFVKLARRTAELPNLQQRSGFIVRLVADTLTYSTKQHNRRP